MSIVVSIMQTKRKTKTKKRKPNIKKSCWPQMLLKMKNNWMKMQPKGSRPVNSIDGRVDV